MSIIDWNEPYEEEKRRSRWGLSQVGDCHRKLSFIDHPGYEPKPLEPRVRRLFRFGDKTEELLAEEIQARGWNITGRQYEIEIRTRLGHIDGLICRDGFYDWALWECKSMSDWSFKKIKEDGVAKHSPQYYDQIQMYMSPLIDVNTCLFTGMNKNNSEIYSQWVRYDPFRVNTLCYKIRMLNKYADDYRIHPIPPYYKGWKKWQCRFCDYLEHCKEVKE